MRRDCTVKPRYNKPGIQRFLGYNELYRDPCLCYALSPASEPHRIVVARGVLEVVEDYENKLKVANEEIAQYKAQIAHLDAELSAVL
ncbi:hypothetical protein AVEN_203507-1 [Araneus ventricosus]|uniref:Uncharacterized protein n=1 Tax=Araneus ventricosus TaxID=182803 RepID=A0A4Y2BGL0_ARAVE|nr:hypothetical protein AVEN_203507-1 [Araneus ventricosus]